MSITALDAERRPVTVDTLRSAYVEQLEQNPVFIPWED